ncbi:MAG: hypothetical protein WCR67_02665 [Bacilli bacterium]
MNETLKKYVKVSLTLGLIASISAVLIGVANAITAPVIKQNEVQSEASSLLAVYGGSSSDYVSYDVSDLNLDYVTKGWTFSPTGDYVFKAYGKNGYGDISLVVGIEKDGDLGKIVIITDTETYKNKLEPNYVDAYNSSDDKSSALDDVKCGATYGAKLIQSMVTEAHEIALGLKKTELLAIDFTEESENE